MEPIDCESINQNINYLLTAFENCKRYTNADMQLLVQLLAAIRTCNDGGPLYNTVVSNDFQPILDQTVTYPIDTFHSVDIMVLSGTITRVIDSAIVEFPTGTVLRYDFTTLNQSPITFIVKAGAHVAVDYLIETV